MIVNSARDLAHGINDAMKLGLTPRPWNLYDPGDTFWWLVPATEWPAYRYGKLAFSQARDTPRKDLLGINDRMLDVDGIFAGFNVEKGYGAVAAFVNPSLKRKPAQFVDPRWLWFEITGAAGAAQFSRTLATAVSQAEIRIYVVVGYAHDREASTGGQRDAVLFTCNANGLSWALDNRCPIDVLRGTKRVTTFGQLAEHLRSIDDYHWADLYVGTHVTKGDVDLADLHLRVLSCFDAWLK
jgi:hypothetical protein